MSHHYLFLQLVVVISYRMNVAICFYKIYSLLPYNVAIEGLKKCCLSFTFLHYVITFLSLQPQISAGSFSISVYS
jgi:hypothetical protein